MSSVNNLGFFSFCLPEKNPNNEITLLCSGNLVSSMALFWRVKKLKFYADANGEFGIIMQRPQTKETELVCETEAGQWDVEKDGDAVGEFNGSMNPAWYSKEEDKVYWFFSAYAVNDSEQKQFNIIEYAGIGEYELKPYLFGADEEYSMQLAVVTGESNLDPTMEILEWWEYDPNDGGGPKYDKTTGKTLRTDI